MGTYSHEAWTVQGGLDTHWRICGRGAFLFATVVSAAGPFDDIVRWWSLACEIRLKDEFNGFPDGVERRLLGGSAL